MAFATYSSRAGSTIRTGEQRHHAQLDSISEPSGSRSLTSVLHPSSPHRTFTARRSSHSGRSTSFPRAPLVLARTLPAVLVLLLFLCYIPLHALPYRPAKEGASPGKSYRLGKHRVEFAYLAEDAPAGATSIKVACGRRVRRAAGWRLRSVCHHSCFLALLPHSPTHPQPTAHPRTFAPAGPLRHTRA